LCQASAEIPWASQRHAEEFAMAFAGFRDAGEGFLQARVVLLAAQTQRK